MAGVPVEYGPWNRIYDLFRRCSGTAPGSGSSPGSRADAKGVIAWDLRRELAGGHAVCEGSSDGKVWPSSAEMAAHELPGGIARLAPAPWDGPGSSTRVNGRAKPPDGAGQPVSVGA